MELVALSSGPDKNDPSTTADSAPLSRIDGAHAPPTSPCAAAGPPRAIAGVAEACRYLQDNPRPIYFISATSFNLLGVDADVGNFEFITSIDSCDGRHPPVLSPREHMHEPFTSIEFPITDLDAGNYTLRALAIDELGIESRAAPVSFAVNVSLPAPAPATEASAAPAADTSANDTGVNDTGATPAIAEAVGESNAPANTAASSPTEIVLLPDGADTLQGSTWRIPIANIDVRYVLQCYI